MAESDEYAREDAGQPPSLHPPYRSTALRSPSHPLVRIPQTLTETTGPDAWERLMGPAMADLTAQHADAPQGQRIVVAGRVLDERGRPVRNTLVELWQCNAAGRYVHRVDRHHAPLDPNFLGAGRCITDKEGRYRFLTIKPGAYPWGNHPNAWRPNHIHFSLFGEYFASRLVTQMYFPGDPLMAIDPILRSVPEDARQLMVADFSMDLTEEGFALGYQFDIVLRGPKATPMETPR